MALRITGLVFAVSLIAFTAFMFLSGDAWFGARQRIVQTLLWKDSIVINNQPAGGYYRVAYVRLSRPGVVVLIQGNDFGKPGDLGVGVSPYLGAGSYRNVTVAADPARPLPAGTTIFAVIFEDNGTGERTGTEQPVRDAFGKPVIARMTIQ